MVGYIIKLPLVSPGNNKLHFWDLSLLFSVPEFTSQPWITNLTKLRSNWRGRSSQEWRDTSRKEWEASIFVYFSWSSRLQPIDMMARWWTGFKFFPNGKSVRSPLLTITQLTRYQRFITRARAPRILVCFSASCSSDLWLPFHSPPISQMA